ncbi:MAG: hypothetical protein LBS40_02730 [Burkholderiales bacterium]|jgi:hypothetical protein|nr:hypothetical protein [Burkholderiales bacterium]
MRTSVFDVITYHGTLKILANYTGKLRNTEKTCRTTPENGTFAVFSGAGLAF